MNPPVTITLNGAPHAVDLPCSLAGMLDNLGLAGKPVVVELNEQAVFPRDYANIPLEDGARLEIVTLAAGG